MLHCWSGPALPRAEQVLTYTALPAACGVLASRHSPRAAWEEHWAEVPRQVELHVVEFELSTESVTDDTS